jgi:Holliday junction resolvase RusA-like endonuclease
VLAGSRRRVTITRRFAGRCQELDRDNLVGGAKPLVDALALAGLVLDDDKAHIELHVLQERHERNETLVVVEELA